jgi:tRNA pseudouridine38-40 synthase
MRYAVGVEYDGSGYAGWQHQGHARTVQQVVEAAFARVADHPVAVVAAGRTDAGVHATGQVIHFESDAARSERAWLLGVNSNLPPDVSLAWLKPVPDAFHARFSALARGYRYVILNRATRSGLLRARATWIHAPLDAAAMHEAAQALLGEHDFSAYRAAACQSRTPMRRVDAVEVRRDGEFVTLEITANAFLHHMVRNVAGVLLEIGRGERPVAWAAEILAGRERAAAGVTAPPDGLYLADVAYPAEYGLPRGRPPGIAA